MADTCYGLIGLMAIARAAAWYQLIDLKKLVRRVGLRFLPAVFRVWLRFLVRFVDIELLACNSPRGLRPAHEVPTGDENNAPSPRDANIPDSAGRPPFAARLMRPAEPNSTRNYMILLPFFNPTGASLRSVWVCARRLRLNTA